MTQYGLNSKMIALENFIISERKRVLVLGSSYPFKWMFKEEANYIKTVENGWPCPFLSANQHDFNSQPGENTNADERSPPLADQMMLD